MSETKTDWWFDVQGLAYHVRDRIRDGRTTDTLPSADRLCLMVDAIAAERAAHTAALAHAEHERQTVVDATTAQMVWLKSTHAAALAEKDAEIARLKAELQRESPTDVAQRIGDYLYSGGLFNPELARHYAVRDLLIDARHELFSLSAERDAAYTRGEAAGLRAHERAAHSAALAEKDAESDTLRNELRAVREFRGRERRAFLNLVAYIRGEASYLLNAECVDAYDALAMERVFLSAEHDATLRTEATG